MSLSKLTLNEFDFKFASCSAVTILGKRRTGKTTLANLVIQKLYDAGHKRFIIFCGNKENIAEWQKIIPALYIHGADINKLQELMDYQNKRVGDDHLDFDRMERERERRNPDYVPAEYNVPLSLQVTIVLDDLGYCTEFIKSKAMKELASNGRHSGCTTVQILQYITQAHIECRDNQDYIFLLQLSNMKGIDRLWKEYVTDTCIERKIFGYVLASCTNKHGKCLVINNACPDPSIENRLRYAKIPYPPSRRMCGSQSYIRFAKQHYLAENVRVNASSRRKLEMTPRDGPLDLDQASDDIDSSIPRRLHENRKSFRDKKGNVVQIQLNHIKED